MDHHEKYHKNYTCELCDRIFRGVKLFEEHKLGCTIATALPVVACSCFNADYGYFCVRHEGDE